MNSAFIAVKGDDGILAYTGSTFPLSRGKYREYNQIIYRSKQTIAGGAFNAAQWDVIGVTSGNSVSVGLITDSNLTGSTSGNTIRVGLGNTTVTAGLYSRATINVNNKGRIVGATGNTGSQGGFGTFQYQIANGATSGTTQFQITQSKKAITLGTRGAGGTGTTSFTIGTNNVASGTSTFAGGDQSRATSDYGFAFGYNARANGYASTAFGQGISNGSTAFSANQGIANGSISVALGSGTIASGTNSFAGGRGNGGGTNREIKSSGLSSFIWSSNSLPAASAYAAAGDYSVILGGENNSINSANTGTAIIGGNNIVLTGGTDYQYTLIAQNVAIWTAPSAGSSDDVLTWNSTTKKVGKVTQASLSQASAVGPNAAVQFKNGTSFSGTSRFIWANSGALTINNGGSNTGSFNISSCNLFFGSSLSIGLGSPTHNLVFGTGSTANQGSYVSLIFGGQNDNQGRYNAIIGRSNSISSNTEASMIFGSGNTINTGVKASVAIGMKTSILGSYSFVTGYNTRATGSGGFAGGLSESSTDSRPVISNGKAAFAYTYNDSSQSSGHGSNANYGAILGGRNNNIASANTGATIIGGNSVKLTTAGYAYHTAVSNLVINDTPSGHTSQDVLTWDSVSKKVGKVTQTSLGASYNAVAYVSKNGNDSTGQVTKTNKPFLTIQAALSAISVGSFTSTNRGLVVVMPGSYTGSITLINYVDIELNSAYIATEIINNSTVNMNFFGNGIIEKLTVNVGSKISVNCEKISYINHLNVDGVLNVRANIIDKEIRWSSGIVNVFAPLITGIIVPNGIAGTVLNECTINAGIISGSTIAPLYIGSSNSGNVNINIIANKIINTSTSADPAAASILRADSNFSGNITVIANEMISYGTSPTLSIVGSTGKFTFGGKIINKNGGNISAISVTLGGGGRLTLLSGTALIPSGIAESITSVSSTNVVALGSVFGKNDKHANITFLVGTFAFDSTYVT